MQLCTANCKPFFVNTINACNTTVIIMFSIFPLSIGLCQSCLTTDIVSSNVYKETPTTYRNLCNHAHNYVIAHVHLAKAFFKNKAVIHIAIVDDP